MPSPGRSVPPLVKILTMWGWRESEDSPELLVAWDEYTADANPGGFDRACDEALRDNGFSYANTRLANLHLTGVHITRMFAAGTVEARVEPMP